MDEEQSLGRTRGERRRYFNLRERLFAGRILSPMTLTREELTGFEALVPMWGLRRFGRGVTFRSTRPAVDRIGFFAYFRNARSSNAS